MFLKDDQNNTCLDFYTCKVVKPETGDFKYLKSVFNGVLLCLRKKNMDDDKNINCQLLVSFLFPLTYLQINLDQLNMSG